MEGCMGTIKMSIKHKLLIYFFALILIPITLIAIFSWKISTDSIEDQANAYTEEVLEQVNQSIEFYVHDMENIIYMLSNNQEVLRFLKVGPGDLYTGQAEKELHKYKVIHPEIAGMLIVSRYQNYISKNLYKETRDSLEWEFWYSKAKKEPEAIHLFSQPIGRNIKGIPNYSADEVVSISKAIHDPNTHEFLGVIVLDLKTEIIKDLINNVTFGKKGFVYVQDDRGNMVYAPVNKTVYRIKDAWLESNSNIEKTIDGSRYQILSTLSDYTKWRIVGVFSLDKTLASAIKVRNVTLLISCAVLVVAISVAAFFATSIAKPIKYLQELMKKAEEGDLSVRCENLKDDELGSLGSSFNTMIVEIDQLIKMVYKEQKDKREAELGMLQSQINPHFLYNTLDTIQWMALENGVTDIVRIIEALTRLFRIGLSKGKDLITLEEEIQHVSSYLTIQKVRYEDKLEYSISVIEDMKGILVPKLMLQPLVENSIYHGVKEKRSKGHISIEMERLDETLRIVVRDDGKGMTDDILESIQMNLESKVQENKVGYGMFNVHERIQLLYGEDFGITIHSEENRGTEVSVDIPLRIKGGEKIV